MHSFSSMAMDCSSNQSTLLPYPSLPCQPFQDPHDPTCTRPLERLPVYTTGNWQRLNSSFVGFFLRFLPNINRIPLKTAASSPEKKKKVEHGTSQLEPKTKVTSSSTSFGTPLKPAKSLRCSSQVIVSHRTSCCGQTPRQRWTWQR